MKRLLFILTLIATAILCGCSKFTTAPGENPQGISFIVSMDDGLTKATIDGDGAGANVNRCILQIWDGETLYKTIVRTAPAGTREYSFKGVTLDPEGSYDFLFWADCGTSDGGDLYYSTESLKHVRMLHPENGNDDALDAFCNYLSDCQIDTEYETRLTLRRPLAQLNVIAGDLPSVGVMPLAEEFVPKSVSYSFSGCTGFDVLRNAAVGDPEIISVTDAPIYGEVTEEGFCTIAMTYAFPQDGKSVSAVDIKVKSANDVVIATSCDNVKFMTNYRTNIIGYLMTVEGEFSVTLSPMFDGEIEVN